MFKIFYNPNPFPVKGEYQLDQFDEYHDAMLSALEYAKIYGPTWVKSGGKIIFKYGDY